MLCEEDRALLKNAIDLFGRDHQLLKAAEELGELSCALCRMMEEEGSRLHVAEEMADVEIMLEQLKMILHNEDMVASFRRLKLNRLAARVEQKKTGMWPGREGAQ